VGVDTGEATRHRHRTRRYCCTWGGASLEASERSRESGQIREPRGESQESYLEFGRDE
jgi:hypothetical protein